MSSTVYVNKSSTRKIQALFRKIEKIIPTDYLGNTILAGDFNVNLIGDSREKELLFNLSKSLGLEVIFPGRDTRKGAVLDVMIAPKRLEITSCVVKIQASDHQAVEWIIHGINPVERRAIKVVNKKLARLVSVQALYGNEDSQGFLSEIMDANRKYSEQAYIRLCPRKFERRLFKSLVSCDGEISNDITFLFWKDQLEENERLRFSQFSKEAFSLLRKIYSTTNANEGTAL